MSHLITLQSPKNGTTVKLTLDIFSKCLELTTPLGEIIRVELFEDLNLYHYLDEDADPTRLISLKLK
jgi:hypothetical protein